MYLSSLPCYLSVISLSWELVRDSLQLAIFDNGPEFRESSLAPGGVGGLCRKQPTIRINSRGVNDALVQLGLLRLFLIREIT